MSERSARTINTMPLARGCVARRHSATIDDEMGHR